MNRVQHGLMIVLFAALSTLTVVQGYYLWRQLVHPKKGLRLTFALTLPPECRLPPHRSIKEGIFETVRTASRNLTLDQIHLSLIRSEFVASLPAVELKPQQLAALEERLNGQVECRPVAWHSKRRHADAFRLQQAEIFDINRPRPLDFFNLLTLLGFSVYMGRLYLVRRSRNESVRA